MTETKRLPLLLEVGTDELPARFLPVEREFLASALRDLLGTLNLQFDDLRVLASPRRLALLVGGLEIRQADVEMEVKGPPLQVAYDADGRPTKAALGFAAKNKLDLAEAYEIEDAKGGRFLAARVVVPGRETGTLLAEHIPQLLLSVPFPKTMHWGTADLEYARPVQWLVALLGDEVIPMDFAGVSAGSASRGHRTLADNQVVKIDSPSTYVKQLREAFVIVDQDERRTMVTDGVEKLLADLADAVWLRDEELLNEVIDLCEYPTPFSGSFEDSFFELPSEVIVTALKAHQRYFAVDAAGVPGRLKPMFVSVRDGGDEALDKVRAGNEKVLRARLSDALFYWHFDQKLTPDQHVDRLGDVTWIEGFGSVRDKTTRVETMCAHLWENGLGDGSPCPESLLRAARLYKFDIVTEMVRDGKEFTKLEGVIGARYAKLAGESQEVCTILENFHKPRSAADSVPTVREAVILSLAERFDTLTACWLAGLAPTGAKDPYALRRHALAVLRIVQENNVHLSLSAALQKGLDAWSGISEDRKAKALGELSDFIGIRLEGLLVQSGFAQDVVRAVIAAHGNNPAETRNWAEALAGFVGREDFILLAAGYKRCRNILSDRLQEEFDAEACIARWLKGGQSVDGLSFDHLAEPKELQLRDQVVSSVPLIQKAAKTYDYAGIFGILSELGPAIDDFFDTVRVNVEDEELRNLRQLFLQEIYGLFSIFADFSQVISAEKASE